MVSRNAATATSKDDEVDDFEECPADDELRPTTSKEQDTTTWATLDELPPMQIEESMFDSRLTTNEFPQLPLINTVEPQVPVAEMRATSDPSPANELEQGRGNTRPIKQREENPPPEGSHDPTSTRRKTRPVLVTSSAGPAARGSEQSQTRSPSTKRRGKTGQHFL